MDHIDEEGEGCPSLIVGESLTHIQYLTQLLFFFTGDVLHALQRVLPREGHLVTVLHIYGYIKNKRNYVITYKYAGC